MPKIDIVIPAAGMGRRMKSFGPKALIPVGTETVIARQIRLLTAAYPNARVIVVAGFEADRIKRSVPSGVKFVINRDYQTTNVARSLQLGLAASHKNRPTLVVYGDLVFNSVAIEGLPTNVSSVVVEAGGGRVGEVGVNIVDGHATNFSYGLDPKWAHIVMLTPHEKRLFLGAARRVNSSRLFGYELLNSVLDAGGEFQVRNPAGVRLVEIDTSKDIELADRIDSGAIDSPQKHGILKIGVDRLS